jgi:hypothetical protein
VFQQARDSDSGQQWRLFVSDLLFSFPCPTGKPYGLLSLLEEECSLGNATDLSYIAKIDKTFGTGKSAANKFYVKNKTKPDCFSVCHFAGAVEYNVAGFLDKNRDTLSVTAREVGVGCCASCYW